MTQQIYIGTICWHLLLTCNKGPQNINSRPPLEKRVQYESFPFQLGLSSRHEVCSRWPFNLRLCSHSRKDRYGELHLILGIINSPTLRSSWTEVSSAQRERLTFDKVFGL